MRVFVLLMYITFLNSASEQLSLQTKLDNFKSVSGSKQSENDYKNFFRKSIENHLLSHLVLNRSQTRAADNSSSECVEAIMELIGNDVNAENFQFLDAWGKIPSGILYGHSIDLGNFDECLSARKIIGAKEVRGRYFRVRALLNSNIPSTHNNTSPLKDGSMIDIFSKDSYSKFSLSLGTCFPNVCTASNVREIFETSIKTLDELIGNNNGNHSNSNMPINFRIQAGNTAGDNEFNAAAILAISIFSFIGVLMLLSSTYDYFMMQMTTPPNQLLTSFSIFTNGRKLFHISTNKTGNNIDCLNGIRVLSMVWVIFGHSHLLFTLLSLTNPIDIPVWIASPYSMLLQTATVSVDSFLLISGVLLVWVAMPKMDKESGKLNVPLMYFHRYIRLTPILAAAVLFVTGILPLIGNGPFSADLIGFTTEGCRKNWWVTLLYLNNYLRTDGLCLVHTWYLSVDTQLFLISPLLLIGLWKWKTKFLWLLLLLCVLSIGCCISTMISLDLNGILVKGLLKGKQSKRIYFPTHIRMAPWLIGVAFGYWLYHDRNSKPHLRAVHLTLGWIVAFSLMMAVIFGPYHLAKNNTDATVLEAALYASLARCAWVIGLAWIIFVCQKGYSSTVNAILSYAGWQPIVRLTYSMYIISVIVQTVNVANKRTDSYFSSYNIIKQFWSELGITMTFAIVAVLAFESPVIAIEKYFFTPKKAKIETSSIQAITLENNS